MIARGHREHAVHANDILDVLKCGAQGDAELFSTGLASLERLRHCFIQQRECIKCMTAEGRAWTKFGFIRGDLFPGHFFNGIAVGQLLVHQHRARRQQRAVGIFTHHPQKV